jgi:catechol 2,3-dioxygenase-like lactoylglutathione lyase family enzyme
MAEPRLSHVGVCVRDVERSTRFYCEALGFERAEVHTVGDEFAPLMSMDGVDLTSQFLRRGDQAIELLQFGRPEPAAGVEQPINTFGLTHLSFLVDDVDAVAARIQELGGTVDGETRTRLGELDFVYCRDPDGTRVELMRLTG